MEEAENAGVNESVARVMVDEAVTHEQFHRLTYRVPADDRFYRLERIARPQGLPSRTRVPGPKSSAYLGQHASL